MTFQPRFSEGERQHRTTVQSIRGAIAARPALDRRARNAWHALRRVVESRRVEVEAWTAYLLEHTSEREWHMLTQPYDDTTPLPDDAATELSLASARLQELKETYAATGWPVTTASVWNENAIADHLDLRYFRGEDLRLGAHENPYMYQYREWPRAMALKYFVFAEYVRARDSHNLLERLGEDGAFGCWTFDYAGRPKISRDLLDSVNELLFLDRHLGVLGQRSLRVLDIGAGYGRTAYRTIQAAADVDDYCCVDAVPASTLLCDYYLRHRGCTPPARVVPLPEIHDRCEPRHFDLAVNIHSFSECTYASVSWWLDWIEHLEIPHLFIVPNDMDKLLAFEPDGTRRDFLPLVERAGYELAAAEPVFDDPAVSELMRVTDHFLLFRRVR